MAWGKKWAMEQDRLLEVAYRLAGVKYNENLFQKRTWQQIIHIKPHSHYAINKKFEKESMEAILEVQTQLSRCDKSSLAKRSRSRVKTLAKALNSATVKSGTHCLIEVKPDPRSTPKELNEVEAHTPGLSKRLEEVLIHRLQQRKHSWSWSGLLLDPDKRGTLRPQIQVQCIHCLDKTVFGRNKCATVIDCEPRWTRTDPPKYVERYLRCGTCNRNRRLIPIDNDIPTLSELHVCQLYKSVSNLSQDTQLQRLRALRPASKVHRFQRAANRFRTNQERPRHIKALWEVTAYDPKRPRIEVQCSFCGNKGAADNHPLWLKMTGEYLALRFYSCKSRECRLYRRHRIPQDRNVPYISQRSLQDKFQLQISSTRSSDGP